MNFRIGQVFFAGNFIANLEELAPIQEKSFHQFFQNITYKFLPGAVNKITQNQTFRLCSIVINVMELF